MNIRPLLVSFAALAASAAVAPETLFDDLVEVAPGQVRTLAVPARRAPARLACSFHVLRGAEARLILIPAESVELWLEGKAPEEVAATGFGRAGGLAPLLPQPRELVLLVQARNGAPRVTRLKLLVRVLDPAAPLPVSRPADRQRGELLVWLSFALFASIAVPAALRLQRLFSMRR
jgi:hypothetical protein